MEHRRGSCPDPGIFVRGGPGQSDKKSFDNVLGFFLVKDIYHFSRFQRGSNIFQGGGGPTFSRGSNCLFPVETHISCDFSRRGPDPLCPPLDPHLRLVLQVQLRCGSLSITTPVSHLGNEFDVRSELHGQVSLAAVNQILCHS